MGVKELDHNYAESNRGEHVHMLLKRYACKMSDLGSVFSCLLLLCTATCPATPPMPPPPALLLFRSRTTFPADRILGERPRSTPVSQ